MGGLLVAFVACEPSAPTGARAYTWDAEPLGAAIATDEIRPTLQVWHVGTRTNTSGARTQVSTIEVADGTRSVTMSLLTSDTPIWREHGQVTVEHGVSTVRYDNGGDALDEAFAVEVQLRAP